IRVEARDGLQVPKLLREATYRSYRAATWNSGNGQRGEFETINAENTNSTLWVLVPGKETSARVNIACYLPGGTGLLPLPKGSARLEQLPAFILHKSPLGSVLAEGPNLVIFDACYSPEASMDSPPNQEDLEVASRGERPGIGRRDVAAI